MALIDQRLLPLREEYKLCRTFREVAEAIKTMVVRGAPAIGVAAAMGIALGVKQSRAATPQALRSEFDEICATLAATRPTAVNLFWAIGRMREKFERIGAAGREPRNHPTPPAAGSAEHSGGRHRGQQSDGTFRRGAGARSKDRDDHLQRRRAGHRRIRHGAGRDPLRDREGKKVDVIALETRPFLQGARLTAWELQKDGIPTTLITDSMAGHFLHTGRVGCVVVGADRIAANGDVANKIGTYSVAVLAKENSVPFYVAAPMSTLDLNIPSGDTIPIEQRAASEVTEIQGVEIAPRGIAVSNPAFDVTPHRYITAIITERGVARPPYAESLRRLKEG